MSLLTLLVIVPFVYDTPTMATHSLVGHVAFEVWSGHFKHPLYYTLIVEKSCLKTKVKLSYVRAERAQKKIVFRKRIFLFSVSCGINNV